MRPSGTRLHHLVDKVKRTQAGGVQLLLAADAAAARSLPGDGLDLHRRGQVGEVLRCPGRAGPCPHGVRADRWQHQVTQDEKFAVQAGPLLRRQAAGEAAAEHPLPGGQPPRQRRGRDRCRTAAAGLSRSASRVQNSWRSVCGPATTSMQPLLVRHVRPAVRTRSRSSSRSLLWTSSTQSRAGKPDFGEDVQGRVAAAVCAGLAPGPVPPCSSVARKACSSCCRGRCRSSVPAPRPRLESRPPWPAPSGTPR